MVKNYSLVIGLLMASAAVSAQDMKRFSAEEVPVKLSDYHSPPTTVGQLKQKLNQNKALGDTLYYEDFDSTGTGGIPPGWTIFNGANNSNNWVWEDTPPGGQYTSVSTINSTSAANGYLSLPSDYYNTPFPPGGPIVMDAGIESPAIVVSPSPAVVIQWQQSQRYCCSSGNELVLEVSLDQASWTTFDAKFGRNPNTAEPNPSSAPAELAQINVTSILSMVDTFYLRFRSTGNSHYYWMIDDLLIFEGASDLLLMDSLVVNYTDSSLNPIMTMVPQLALDPLTFVGNISNTGITVQNGVGLEIRAVQDSTYSGGPGAGTVALMSSLLGAPLNPTQKATLNVGPYVNTGDGYYRFIYRVFSNNPISQSPSTLIAERSLVVTDSVLAKDRGPYIGGAGPGNYVGGGNNGDRWGSLMTVGSHPSTVNGILATSISVLVANDLDNIGASIQPRVWEWDNTASTIGAAILSPPVGTSPFSTTIDTTMLGQWITLPLIPPGNISAGKQYVVGWEQTGGGNSGAEFSAARDRYVEPYQQAVTNFVFVTNASPTWGWVTQVAAIRLNLNLTIGLEEQESFDGFFVYPNPNDGNFIVHLSSDQPKTYTMSVRNTLGQLVYTSQVAVNGKKQHQLDVSELEKGVYFLSLENGNERLVKKVIIH